MDWLHVAGPKLILVAVMFWLIAWMGTTTGMNVAANETADYGEERAELVGAMSDMNISDDGRQAINQTGVGWIVEGFRVVSVSAFDFGHNHGLLATVWWYLSPVTVLGGVAVYVGETYRRFKRGTV